MEYSEKALAKLTLTLRVLDKREDGYNNIDALTTYCSDLFDLLKVQANQNVSLNISDVSSVEKKLDLSDNNLILVAYRIFKEKIREFQNEESNFTFEIEKHIPAGAGLGGGSADCAATLRVLNDIYENQFILDELMSMASQMGSDISGCVISQILKMTKTGNEISTIDNDVSFLNDYHTVIITPDIYCSTPEIYQRYDEIGRPAHEGIIVPKDFEVLTDNFHNDLEISALDLNPELKDFKKHIESICDIPFMLAGSGSSIFCVLDNEKAQNVYSKLKIELQNELIHEKIRQLAISAIC